jgi:hypothetical protein
MNFRTKWQDFRQMVMPFLNEEKAPEPIPESSEIYAAPPAATIQPYFAFFDWPKTGAPIGGGRLPSQGVPEKGLLSHFGYGVGENGKAEKQRRDILSKIFELKDIPHLESDEYVAEWGGSCSALRLKKMAYSIAEFCKMEKRRQKKRGHNMGRSIDNHEKDLAWLKTKYYDGKFDNKMPWAHTNVAAAKVEQHGELL